MQQLLTAHLYKSPPRASSINPWVPASLDAVIERGMAKEPDHRYGSAGAFARAAGRAVSGGGPPVSQPIPVRDPWATQAAPHTLAPTGYQYTDSPSNHQRTQAAPLTPPTQPTQAPELAVPQGVQPSERKKWIVAAAVAD